MATYGAGLYGAGIYSGGSELTLTELTEAWPSRVRILVTGLSEGQVVTVSRTTPDSTVRTPVRGAHLVDVTDSNMIFHDLEQPFGVLLTYYLTIGGELDGVDNDSATITTTLSGGHGVPDRWPQHRRVRSARRLDGHHRALHRNR
jgi:hypothetical protein